jgi:hypothetical protein
MWMSNVRAVEPDSNMGDLLAGAQFADAFSISIGDNLDARHAAERMMTRAPRWTDILIVLRNIIVAPFGLKTGAHNNPDADIIGIFPVVSETPERLVAGFDDKHLDFRVVVDVADAGSGRNVTATTLVLTHNLLGRFYLAAILPFHRLVVRAMLRQI